MVLVVYFYLVYSKRLAIFFQLNSLLNVNSNGGETIEEATPNKYLYNLILNAIKLIRNSRKDQIAPPYMIICKNRYLSPTFLEIYQIDCIIEPPMINSKTNQQMERTLTSSYMKEVYKIKIQVILLLN